MTWAELTRDWTGACETLREHFPLLEEGPMASLGKDKGRFTSYLAKRHALTEAEAQEAIDDFLLVQAIWRHRLASPRHA